MKRWFIPGLLALAACSSSSSSSTSGSTGSGTTGSGVTLSAGERSNGTCPTSPTRLTGTKQADEACSAPEECQPVCCSCSDSSQWLAAYCLQGKCTPNEACTTTESQWCY